jgi:hypothetical protein
MIRSAVQFRSGATVCFALSSTGRFSSFAAVQQSMQRQVHRVGKSPCGGMSNTLPLAGQWLWLARGSTGQNHPQMHRWNGKIVYGQNTQSPSAAAGPSWQFSTVLRCYHSGINRNRGCGMDKSLWFPNRKQTNRTIPLSNQIQRLRPSHYRCEN